MVLKLRPDEPRHSGTYDPAWFDGLFYGGGKGSDRGHDSPMFAAEAVFANTLYGGHGYSFLDAGCGMGFVVRRLRDIPRAFALVDGIDISEHAIAHAVTPGLICHDLRRLEDLGRSWDVIFCDRVLEYLPADDIQQVLCQFAEYGGRLFLGVISTDHSQCLEYGVDWYRENGRITMEPGAWWQEQAELAGWIIEEGRWEAYKEAHPEWEHGKVCWTLA